MPGSTADAPPTLARLPGAARHVLRAPGDVREAISARLGVPLAASIGEVAAAGDWRALKLGPDEWVLAGPRGAHLPALCDTEASLVDVGAGTITIAVRGRGAADLLAHGCPRDLSALTPGHGARTVFDAITVVVWRTDDGFDVDVARSLAPHVEARLAEAAAQMRTGL